MSLIKVRKIIKERERLREVYKREWWRIKENLKKNSVI